MAQLTAFLENCGKAHRFSTYIRYEEAVRIEWNNASGSLDDFEFEFVNNYTIGHFSFEGGESSLKTNARKITKDN
jgi:hypothetical protein